jgi:hypothetical protein
MVKLRLVNAVIVVFFIFTLAAASVFGQSDPSDTSSNQPDQTQPSEAAPAPASPSEANVQSSPTASNQSSVPGAAAERCPAGETGCNMKNALDNMSDRVNEAKRKVLENPTEGVGEAKKALKYCAECVQDAVTAPLNSFRLKENPLREPNSVAQPPPLSGAFGDAVTEEKQVEQQQDEAQQEQQRQQKREEEAQRRADAARTPEPQRGCPWGCALGR